MYAIQNSAAKNLVVLACLAFIFCGFFEIAEARSRHHQQSRRRSEESVGPHDAIAHNLGEDYYDDDYAEEKPDKDVKGESEKPPLVDEVTSEPAKEPADDEEGSKGGEGAEKDDQETKEDDHVVEEEKVTAEKDDQESKEDASGVDKVVETKDVEEETKEIEETTKESEEATKDVEEVEQNTEESEPEVDEEGETKESVEIVDESKKESEKDEEVTKEAEPEMEKSEEEATKEDENVAEESKEETETDDKGTEDDVQDSKEDDGVVKEDESVIIDESVIKEDEEEVVEGEEVAKEDEGEAGEDNGEMEEGDQETEEDYEEPKKEEDLLDEDNNDKDSSGPDYPAGYIDDLLADVILTDQDPSNYSSLGNILQTNKTASYRITPGIGQHKLYSTMKTWNRAREHCIQEGSHLAVINSFEEERLILQMLAGSDANWPWVGVHDMFEEGHWVSVHDVQLELTGYFRWSSKFGPQPDNMYGVEHCAYLGDSGLFDGHCVHMRSFICEKPIKSRRKNRKI